MRFAKPLCLVFTLALLFTLGACSGKPGPSPVTVEPAATSPAVEKTEAPPSATEPAQAATDTVEPAVVELPDPLDNLLGLRGIRFTLTGVRPDGANRSISGEIDAAGNMRLTYTKPPINFQEIVPESTMTIDALTYGIYLINGASYSAPETDPAWADNPLDPDYLSVLSNQLHSLYGFTMWLDMLPAGSLQPAGSEQVGGFTADKYTVSGLVSEQKITGALWYDSPTHSLVKAELHVPAMLDSDPEKPLNGEILITLTAEKADIEPLPLLTSTGNPAAVVTPNSLPSSQPSKSEPYILNTYQISDMPYAPGGADAVLLTLPDGIWTADRWSGLQEFDPQTGKLIRKVPLEVKNYYDLKFDSSHLWVLASIEEPNHADILYVLDLPSAQVARVIPITNQGIYSQSPLTLGISPGKIWVNFGIVDTQTLEYTPFPNGLPSEARFAYDGQRWMWATGSWCDGCHHDLWIIDGQNPPDRKDEENSGVLNTGVLGKPLVLAGGRMWVLAVYDTNSGPNYFLDAYDLDQTARPVLHIDVTAEVENDSGHIWLAADDAKVWLGADGVLTYIDAASGDKIGSLAAGENITGMSFNGNNLWVISGKAGLLQVTLPWQH